MANITISNLHPAGSDLFSDSETYMKELSELELGVQGGLSPIIVGTIVGTIIATSPRDAGSSAR